MPARSGVPVDASPAERGVGSVTRAAVCIAAVAACALSARGGDAPTSAAELWREYAKSPNAHSHVPNCSYAGYRCSEKPIPEVGPVADVKAEGAKGDGAADDTPAFRAAVEKAKKAGGGCVLVPAGTYRITDVIALDQSGLVLRGEGPEKTVLAFEKSLQDIKGARGSLWSWNGGLVWVEPGRSGGRDGPAIGTVRLRRPAKAGEHVAEVAASDARKLERAAGRMLRLAWRGDLSLCMHIAGHESMRSYDWSSWGAFRDGTLTWEWPNEIVKVEGTKVHFKKPLRLDVRPEWEVTISELWNTVREVGVEGMTLRMPRHRRPGHLKDPGFNGVFLKQAVHSWVRDVAMENVDNGVIVDRSANCTVTGLRLTGASCHHATMCRSLAHDNLIEKFRIEARPQHGINTEGTSSGNVWRAGEMLHGAFDSHCMMSFDSVRTNITINCDGGPGGARDHGPFVGRRMTHWNVRLTGGKNEWVFGPAYLPSGAIVGGQGGGLFTRDTGLWHMPDGPKGCLVVGHGTAPEPADLFEAQLRLRLESRTKKATKSPARARPNPPRAPVKPKESPEEREARVLYEFARALVSQGQRDAAKGQFESVIERFPDSPYAAKAKKYLERLR